jgi:two-component system cell cycle response regulator
MPSAVLIIEDNRENLELMQYLLASSGHAILTATGGEEGLRLAETDRPDLILLDIHMPGMDGFAVIEAIRSTPAIAETDVVAVTALAMVGDREAILKAGFDGYISKPISPVDFVSEVEARLAAGRPGESERSAL